MKKIHMFLDMPMFNLVKGKEYLILHETETDYYVEINSKLVQMVSKGSEGITYDVYY